MVIIAVLAIIAALLINHQANNSGVNSDSALVKHDAAVTTQPKTGETVPKTKNAISVSTQKAGSSIDIDEVSLQKPGYVVIHADDNGKPGAIVAHSGLITAGTKQDLIIRYTTKPGTSYFAMLHSDDGNGVYLATKDLPIIGSDTMPVMVEFTTTK